ncbi:MAG: YqgE/AlgH family protein [Ignavibacteria bacterium]|nr:YqgE/AlgH family protein [Ignavibacteria bacterium]
MNSNAISVPTKGKILISAPFLSDVFKRSVVFLCEHDDKGSLGFIINKPLKYKLNEIINDFPEFDAPVLFGGPVETDLVNFIHRAGDVLKSGYEINNGIYWGGDFEELKELIETGLVKPSDFRFFLGYSGWGAGQLHKELLDTSWFVGEGLEEYIFSTDYNSIWSKALRDLGREFAIISSFPDDPSVN